MKKENQIAPSGHLSSSHFSLVMCSSQCHLCWYQEWSLYKCVIWGVRGDMWQRSDAACGSSVCKDEEGQRVRGKQQMFSRRQAASFKVRKSFVIHHLQRFSVQFHRPSWKTRVRSLTHFSQWSVIDQIMKDIVSTEKLLTLDSVISRE